MKSLLGCIAIFGCVLVGCETSTPTATAPASFGRFEGAVVASWDDDGRNMTLRESFGYVDAQNRFWQAPAGSVVNGASIPYGFWSIIGGPFEGQYRNASVVHDVGCHEMTATWQDVHRMFYEACRCGGVEESRAKMLYYAVYHFGPRWETVHETQVETTTNPNGQLAQREVTVPTVVRIDPPPPTSQEVEQATALIAEENPAPAVIEQTNRDVLRRRPRGGGYGNKPGGPNGFNTARPGEVQPNWQRPTGAPAWNGDRGNAERRPNEGPNQFAAGGERSRPAPQTFAPPARSLQGPAFQPDMRGAALSPQESAWAQNMVRQHLERQTGEQRPAEYNVAKTERGYRVQVQYLQLDSEGRPAGVSGESTLRLGMDGRVMEMINRY
ncbi:DUF1353 domain-containing protein [Anatilimnocola floriformis]|uniref:DUF1353 domain-containing protein n=1 Tax=Anatilimnocola floriformis TaxID=2948575 RepID=UPI0020C49E26|nr:DUF1353 domain-containing protein [Anatilimnocola floriformis]